MESDILHEFNRFGARYPSYNSIIAGGENACILHYSENDMPLCNGDLVLIDAGCEFAMYAGDITRTFPVNGKFSEAQKAIYEIVLQAQKRAIELLVPGGSIAKANEEVIRINTVEPGLYLSKDADIPEQYKGIGIRIEDNLLITDYGNKNLTSAAPKEIADIEKLMADAQSFEG